MNLILGASGTIGSRVARRLLDRGQPVRAVSRDPSRITDLERLGAVAIRGDLRDSEWMPAAVADVRTLVLATHGLVPPTRDNRPGIVDGEGNRRIIDAAIRAGVDHVVFLSATSGPDPAFLFGRVKYATEEYLKACGLTYTIIRPTVFTETHAVLLLGEPLRQKGSVHFFGPGTTRLNWISAEDVADYVVQAIEGPALRNETRAIGGPDHLSRVEALELIEQVLGRTARRTHLPLPLVRAMHLVLGPFHPGMRYLLDMAITEAMRPDDPTWAPSTVDWTGPASLEQVVERWADGSHEFA